MNKSVSPSKDVRDGFILIAVLLLIALVTVLVVVTSFVARIERRAVNNSARIDVARQNALFGLNVALGQLQKEVGPDQRVTARADILDSDPSTPAADGFPSANSSQPNNPGQAYWTGAWKSSNPAWGSQDPAYITGNAQPLDVQFQSTQTTPLLRTWSYNQANNAAYAGPKWLVSDPLVAVSGGRAPLALDPRTALPDAVKMVTLAKNLPDLTRPVSAPGATQPTVSVSAPLVAMQAQGAASPAPTTGQYAYWVSDEGVKAKVNIVDSALNAPVTQFTKNQLHFLTPQSVVSSTGLLSSSTTTNTTDLRTDANLSRHRR